MTTYRAMNEMIRASKAYDAAQRQQAEARLAAVPRAAPASPAAPLRPGSPEWRAAARQEWATLRGRQERQAGPQGTTACGTVNSDGQCMSKGHTPACAATMQSWTSKATFEPIGSAASDRAWARAAEERERGRAAVNAIAPRPEPNREAVEALQRTQRQERRERDAGAARIAQWARRGLV
jgi:hypothetical protein